MEATWKRQNAVSRNTSGADVAREPALTVGRSKPQQVLAPYKHGVTGSSPVPPMAANSLPKRIQAYLELARSPPKCLTAPDRPGVGDLARFSAGARLRCQRGLGRRRESTGA